jgi:dTDP-glucose pyrophosphorylase
MSNISLVVPMAGRGSRFSTEGNGNPKPLIDLNGRPFFWWAVESVRRSITIREMVFVVLEEHCEQFDIHNKVLEYYPNSKVVTIANVTSGAAETARLGIDALQSHGPVAVNDCDHAFVCHALESVVDSLESKESGALLCFRSDSEAYSYLKTGVNGDIIGTVEKKVVSPFAIAGCYLFSSSAVFNELYDSYRDVCSYDELFMSGLYDLLIGRGAEVLKVEAEVHCSFGTPEEVSRLFEGTEFNSFKSWKAEDK